MIDSIYQETRDSMGKSVEALKNELNRMRTGRASLTILDGIKVDYYGTMTPLNQMATLAVPESRLITIQPWDVSVIKDIEKAILKSDLGLTPSSDGKIVTRSHDRRECRAFRGRLRAPRLRKAGLARRFLRQILRHGLLDHDTSLTSDAS